jgi:two-component system LytT family sensor kinase
LTVSPLATSRFRNAFAACWLLWTALDAWLLNGFGFSWSTALADSIMSNVLLMLCCLLVSMIFRFYLPKEHRYGFYLGLTTVLSLLWLLACRSLIFLLNSREEYGRFFFGSIPVRTAFAFLVIGCMTLVCVLWHTLREQKETESRKNDAERLAREAELFKLRQQLQPHFLFNSLNSINALVGARPQQAREMIQQLSDFLRGTLKREERQWVSLEEELQHLHLYLEIEKVRFGHRLDTEIINETGSPSPRLPAMLLQPLVENAIKFGLYDTTEKVNIRIEAFTRDALLVLRVTNPFDNAAGQKAKGAGFGLRSVQRRLYLLFARNDLLQTATEENLFITTIHIPFQHDQDHHH